jgi:long-chain fatty acid transport protein
MSHRIPRSNLAAAVGAALVALCAGPALGAGFALQETSGSQLGNAFAGGAAGAEDVSTMWSNPAGLSRLGGMEVAAAVHLITPSFRFRNDGSVAAAFQPLGSEGGDAGSLNVVPNLYFGMPINRQWSIGVGINAPFGLVTEYDRDWLGRFQGIKSDVKTINVNPAVSWRVADNFAVGVGINWQRVDAEFTKAANYSAALAQAAQQAAGAGLIPASAAQAVVAGTPGLESFARVKGNDNAWGWNAGFLWDVTPQTRVGAHYRSSIKYKVAGNVSFDNPSLPTLPAPLAPVAGQLAGAVNAQLANGGITADIKLPDITNVSVFSRLNDRWDVMGDIQFTKWSVLKELTFVRTNGVVLDSTPENFDDTWRFSVGANYRYNDAWMFRGGLAFDQSPVNTTDRTPRLPDADRTCLSVGAQYKFNRNLKADAGFTYIFVKSPDINQSEGNIARNGLIKGHYDVDVTIFSAQLTYTF